VFIRYKRTDALDQSLENVDDNTVRQWIEEKLLNFLDSYLQIETHEQYQRDNVAIDPVCGMKVAKPKGLAHQHHGQVYYFCAQTCLDRFIKSPNDFVHAITN
jgi:YHS domain-containing protein